MPSILTQNERHGRAYLLAEEAAHVVVTVSTLLLQGMTLPWVINKIGFESNDAREDALAEAQVQHRAAQAAVDRLDQEIEDVPDHVRDQLRSLAEHRGNAAWERLGRQEEESPRLRTGGCAA